MKGADDDRMDAEFGFEVDDFLRSMPEDMERVERITNDLPGSFREVLAERESRLVAFEQSSKPTSSLNWRAIAVGGAAAAAFAGMVLIWMVGQDGGEMVEKPDAPAPRGSNFEFVVTFQPDGETEVVTTKPEPGEAEFDENPFDLELEEYAFVGPLRAAGGDVEERFGSAPERPGVPEVSDGSWPRTTVDRFVMAVLDEHRLVPAGDADRLTLLRRVCFDLTGLPPSAELVESFLRDSSPAAYAEVVDELLASWEFGEHWGGRWLERVGYEPVAGSELWRYREYVIASLNADKPYDRFLEEQLAGDLSGDVEARLATGFFVAGGSWGTPAEQVAGVVLRSGDFPLAEADAVALEEVFGKARRFGEFPLVLDSKKYPPENLVDDDRAAVESKRLLRLIASAERRAERSGERGEMDRVRKLRASVADLSQQLLTLELGERDRIVSSGSEYVAVAGFPSSARRAEYVKRLVGGEHPLTARAQVDRVWGELFGRGLMDDGVASHPELLEFLATEFVDGGWSVKSLVREIVLSRSYQLADTLVAENVAEDPGDRLFWRQLPRALDEGELRDSVIAVAGWLQVEERAPLRMFARYEFKPIPGLQDGHGFRSIYAPAERLDEELLFGAAMSAAGRVGESRKMGTKRRVRDAFRQVLGRKPTAEERDWAVGMIARAGSMSESGILASIARPDLMGERAAYLESLLPQVRVDGDRERGRLVSWAMLYHALMMCDDFREVR